ncbi:YdcF family protein [Aquabacterium humicola]|uniref:YdcF family protein n=1 Tax=Aquabacterium humicola TaxID=3237377 RepID=UPI002543684A|nr:YdcF family protein [Rubrivivax pictus]
MNQLFESLGLLGWKPALSMLVLPPVPLLALIVLGVLLSRRHRRWGAALVLAGSGGLWALSTPAFAAALKQTLTTPPPVLAEADIAALSRTPQAAIVVLGAGRRLGSLDYGAPDLSMLTLERLRYGLWLARRTGLPVAYSGGVAHASPAGDSEAVIATRVAERDFGQRLRWTEGLSRDTNENARRTVPMLAAAGIRHVVLVTHDFHQQRALAAFRRAAAHERLALTLSAAPMGVSRPGTGELGDYLPSGEGLRLATIVLHEWLGRLAGA